ncbi:MAG: helix-turn-helix domain-containing protein [Minisyncoccota bacterium]
MTQDQAFSILKTGANVFLTGEPGSGKTHTINRYVSYLRSHGIEPAITASTGIAATHIGGMTIHSWSGIGIKSTLTAHDLDRIAQNEYTAKRIAKTRVLIIDEVSMLGGDTLHMVDAVCKEIRQNDAPFGGLQAVCVGDFFQLPPISRTLPEKEQAEPSRQSALLKIPVDNDAEYATQGATFAFQSPTWRELNPLVCYLTEQHRQDDPVFLSILSSIRENAVSKEHLAHIRSRMIEPYLVPDDATTLFPHNADVDRVNTAALAKVPGESVSFTMSSQGPDVLVAHLKKGCLSPEALFIKEGASVMFTKNNPPAGFVNGTLGVVVGIHKESGYPLVQTKSGKKIEASPMEWTIEENGKVRAKITQVPLRLAWAITVHKSQGMSLDSAVMDLTSVFEYGQGYVALSRVRRLSGVSLLGLNDRALHVHPDVLKEDEIFRALSSKTEAAFDAIPKDALVNLHNDFVLRSGGTLESGRAKTIRDKKMKGDTYKETLALFQQKKSVAQIAQERGMTQTTVLSHIEHLYAEEKIARDDIMQLMSSPLRRALPTIHAAFDACDTDKLTPVFERLKSVYSFDDLRLARMVRKG